MVQEDKQLLLKDLCGRLPYGVNLHIEFYDLQGEGKLVSRDVKLAAGNIGYCFDNSHWIDIKPYLRPLSSMTDEERDEFRNVGGVMAHNAQNDSWAICAFTPEAYDWLNAHHFDYRVDPSTGKTLIESGLALEAPEGMYKTK